MLEKSDKAIRRGILAIYSLQTWDERRTEDSTEANGVGFNGLDAPFLTSLAKQLQMKGYLTRKQTEKGRKAMLKYAGQLAKIANGELEVNVEYGVYKGN